MAGQVVATLAAAALLAAMGLAARGARRVRRRNSAAKVEAPARIAMPPQPARAAPSVHAIDQGTHWQVERTTELPPGVGDDVVGWLRSPEERAAVTYRGKQWRTRRDGLILVWKADAAPPIVSPGFGCFPPGISGDRAIYVGEQREAEWIAKGASRVLNELDQPFVADGTSGRAVLLWKPDYPVE